MSEKFRIPDTEGVLAVASFGLFALVCMALLFHVVPGQNEKYAMGVLIALISIVKDCFARYFSSTKGGQASQAALAQLAGSGPPPPAAPLDGAAAPKAAA